VQQRQLLSLIDEIDQASSRGEWAFVADLARFTLTRLSRDGAPTQWVRFKLSLATALREMHTGDRAAQLEEAVTALQDAVAMHSRLTETDLSIEARALSRRLLGKLYLERLRGDRAGNIESAIAEIEAAIAALPYGTTWWAIAMTDLGLAYLQRHSGDREENLERAAAHSRDAVDVLLPEANLEAWCDAMLLLASAHGARCRGVAQDNLEVALEAVDQLLVVVRRDRAPMAWARAMRERGALLRRRVRGGRAENQEQALAAFNSACKVLTRKASPIEWAHCLFGLATTLAERLAGDRTDNLEHAATALTQALGVLTPEGDLTEWAEVTSSLGIVYAEAARSGATEHLERAIDAFLKVLAKLARDRDPELWARTMRNLGIAYLDRLDGTRADNVDHAITAFARALEVFTKETAPTEWAETQLNVGIAYHIDRGLGCPANETQALAAFEQALEVFTLDTFPERHASVQRAIAHPCFDRRDWAQAERAYAAALEGTALLFGAGVVPEARQLELRRSQSVPARAAYALARLGRVTDAIELLEQHAAQVLGEILARNEAALDCANPADREAFSQARAQVEALEVAARREGQSQAGGAWTVTDELCQAHRSMRAAVQRIRCQVPDFMPPGMHWAEIAELAQKLQRPLVYLVTTSHGSLALLVFPETDNCGDDERVVWLDELTATLMDRLMEDGPNGKLGYLHAVAGMSEEGGLNDVTEVLDEVWPYLAGSLIGPIERRLLSRGYSEAVLVARGHLALLPLHAVTMQMSFAVAPSARALQAAQRGLEKRARRPLRFLGVGNPSSAKAPPLYFAAAEVRAVSSNFVANSKRVLEREAASRKRLLHATKGATHIHLACHAFFDHRHPLESWLGLAENDRLSLLDVLQGEADLSAVRLVVLSACQTGLADFRGVPSEAIGFPAAFLQRGVPCVVSALWPVDDMSTAALMEKFYELLLGKPGIEYERPAAQAMLQAQRWLRGSTVTEMRLDQRLLQLYQQTGDENIRRWMAYYAQRPDDLPFVHPYYWAGFTVCGV